MAAVAFPEEIVRLRSARRSRARRAGSASLRLVQPLVTDAAMEAVDDDREPDRAFSGLLVPPPPCVRSWSPPLPTPGARIAMRPLAGPRSGASAREHEGIADSAAASVGPALRPRSSERPRPFRSSPARQASRFVLAPPLRRLIACSSVAALGFVALLGASAIGGHRGVQAVKLPGSIRASGGYLYTVRPGDTLWSIATRLYPGADPTPVVAELETRLGGAPVVAGERLLVP
jgi:hypothetical protein